MILDKGGFAFERIIGIFLSLFVCLSICKQHYCKVVYGLLWNFIRGPEIVEWRMIKLVICIFLDEKMSNNHHKGCSLRDAGNDSEVLGLFFFCKALPSNNTYCHRLSFLQKHIMTILLSIEFDRSHWPAFHAWCWPHLALSGHRKPYSCCGES